MAMRNSPNDKTGKNQKANKVNKQNANKKKASNDNSLKSLLDKSVDEHNSSDDDISFNKKDSYSGTMRSLEERIRLLEEKIQHLETTHEAKEEALYRVIDQKDQMIGKLSEDIGELKKSCSYLTNETTELKKCIDENTKSLDVKIKSAANNISDVKSKTVDLEDCSRRCNLVFFNFPEARPNENENCERMVLQLLDSLKILEEEDVYIERAHRLGRRNSGIDKPRPVIVCFSYYKQKQEIIRNGAKFKNCAINAQWKRRCTWSKNKK